MEQQQRYRAHFWNITRGVKTYPNPSWMPLSVKKWKTNKDEARQGQWSQTVWCQNLLCYKITYSITTPNRSPARIAHCHKGRKRSPDASKKQTGSSCCATANAMLLHGTGWPHHSWCRLSCPSPGLPPCEWAARRLEAQTQCKGQVLSEKLHTCLSFTEARLFSVSLLHTSLKTSADFY